MVNKERRRVPRFPFHTSAVLILSAGYQDARLIDISIHGALVEPSDPRRLIAGTECKLRVLTAEDRQALEVGAVVVWTKDDHVGLGIHDISPGAEQALRRLIDMNLGTEALLRRDACALFRPHQ